MARVGLRRQREIILLVGLIEAEMWPLILVTHLRRLLIKWNAPESAWRFDSSFPVEKGRERERE